MKKNTKLLDEMMKSLRKMNGMKVRWGFNDEAEYDNPRGHAQIAHVAQLVEKGHPNGGAFEGSKDTPARPFFKTAVEDSENHRKVRALIKHLQRKVLQGKLSPEDKMEEIGELLAKQLRVSIINFKSPELSPATISMRENRDVYSDDPLIESSAMLDAVDFEVYEV